MKSWTPQGVTSCIPEWVTTFTEQIIRVNYQQFVSNSNQYQYINTRCIQKWTVCISPKIPKIQGRSCRSIWQMKMHFYSNSLPKFVDVHFHLPDCPTRSTLDFRNYRRKTNCPLTKVTKNVWYVVINGDKYWIVVILCGDWLKHHTNLFKTYQRLIIDIRS